MTRFIGILSLFLITLFFISSCSQTANNTIASEPYQWKSVTIVGGGFVDGYLFHPAVKGLMYARTDMGGAYRRDPGTDKWVPLTDWVSFNDRNLMGIESMAIDPNNPDKLYLAAGTYSDTKEITPNGEVLISNDRGASFTRVPVPFKMGGNENGRQHGERLMVDPNNSEILFLGTRHNGLWKSIDGAKTWAQVTSFPDVTQQIPDSVTHDKGALGFWKWAYRSPGISMIRFDASSANEKGSTTIYAFAGLMNRPNFFVSHDAGETWHEVPDQPQQFMPTDAEIDTKGNMYITYGDAAGPWIMHNGAVMKYNTKSGEWTDISPEKSDLKKGLTLGYAAVEFDPQNENKLVVCTYYRSRGDEVFRSIDGGKTWEATIQNLSKFDNSKAPYIATTGIHWLFDFEIDPFNTAHAIFTCGYGGHETFNFTSAEKKDTVVWEVAVNGIEETVPLDLLSPPAGPHLITGIGDYGGFFHWDLDKPNPEGNYKNPHFGNTDGIACAENKPEIVVRVGVSSYQRPNDANIGYTTDMGKTWQPTQGVPYQGAKHGHVAVSVDGNTWIWTPEHSVPYVTKDWGKSWTKVEGVPENIKIVADKVNKDLFYGVNVIEGVYYMSEDGGKTFETLEAGVAPERYDAAGGRGDDRGGQDRIYATPGIEDELWIPAYDGLYYKPAGDELFMQVDDQVEEIHGFGFGKAAPGAEYQAIYLIGVIDEQYGIFRSTDCAETWVRINDDQHQWGFLLQITGDPKQYGRVYVGTHGRGAMYGDPVQ